MLHRRGVLAAALFIASLPATARAATWINGHTTPDVEELIAVDETGEDPWLYGREDLAGDGAAFGAPEQSIDVRSAYAAADANRLWARAYVSSETAPNTNVVVFVFIDADQNQATGGSTAATEIDPRFTFDTGGGGFEHCFAFRGDGTLFGLWHYSQATNAFQPENLMQSDGVGEAGVDTDPMLLGSGSHGYLQGSIDHDMVGTAPACQARLYFRSVDASMSGPSDDEVGDSRPCISPDSNMDGIPDVLVPNAQCASDADCPFFGICEGNRCLVGDPCDDNANCPADRACEEGRCVLAPSGPCGTTDNCNSGLVCADGTCVACASHAECGVGGRCSQDGRCLEFGPGGVGAPEEVEDGCSCATRGSLESARFAGLAALALALGTMRRRRSSREGRKTRRVENEQ